MAELTDVLTGIRAGITRKAYPNETAVRTQIVQRILHVLGWDVFDPDRVCNEYSLKLKTTTRRIDLALCVSNRNPRCIVELKSTDTDLRKIGRSDGDRQLFEYAFHAGAPLALLTNGINWRFYSTYGAGSYAERLVRSLDIETEPPAEIAAALDRYLSYANTASGQSAHFAKEDLDRRIKRRKAREAIPRAWTRLVDRADEGLLARLVEETTAIADSEPQKPDVVDFLRRLRPDGQTASSFEAGATTPVEGTLGTPTTPNRATTPSEKSPPPAPGQPAVRYHLFGTERTAKTAAQAYADIFRALVERDPEFPGRVEPRLRGHKNRGLARTRGDLSANPRMVKVAVALPGGWWLMTNLSNSQKTSALKIACEVAGIRFDDPSGLDIQLPNA